MQRCPSAILRSSVAHDEDPAALRALLDKARKYIWNRGMLSGIPDDEVESLLGAALAKLIGEKVLADKGLATIKAAGGDYDGFPAFMKTDYLDEIKQASAKKRGGDRKRVEVEDVELGFRIVDPAFAHDTPGGPKFSLLGEAELQDLASQLGSGASRVVRFLVEHPDQDDLTDDELAKRLGVTARQLRNIRKPLRTPEGREYLARFTRP